MTVQRLIAISISLCILAASSGYLGTATFADAAANPDGTQGLPGRKLSGWWGGGWGGGRDAGFNRFDGGFRGGSAAAACSAAAAGFGRKLSNWGGNRGWGRGWGGNRGFDGHRRFFGGGRDFDGRRGFDSHGGFDGHRGSFGWGRRLSGIERACYCKDGKLVDGDGVLVSTGFGWWPFLWPGKRFTDCSATGVWGPNGGVITGTFPNGGFAEAAASTGRKMQDFGGFRGGGGNFRNGGFANGGFRDGGGSAAAASSAAAAGRDSAAAAAAAAAAGRG